MNKAKGRKKKAQRDKVEKVCADRRNQAERSLGRRTHREGGRNRTVEIQQEGDDILAIQGVL